MIIGCGPESPGTTDTTTPPTSATDPGTSTSGSTGATSDASAPTMVTTTGTSCFTGDCSSNSSSGWEGCSFLSCPDFGPVCAVAPGDVMVRCCDNFVQDCPRDQKCAAASDDLGSWNTTTCVDGTGAGQPGDECTTDGGKFSGKDSCAFGAMCWHTNDEGVGTCVALCTGTPDSPVRASGHCMIAGDGTLNLCLPSCDPLLQDCPATDLCAPQGDFFLCTPDDSGEEGQSGDPCKFADTCDAGLTCIEPATVSASCDPAAKGCCTPFCTFPGGACPNPDQSCVQWFDPMTLPENDPQLTIGFCGIPQ